MNGNIVINFKNNKIILPKNKKYMRISPFIIFDIYNMKDKVILIGKNISFKVGNTKFDKIDVINIDAKKDKTFSDGQTIKVSATEGIKSDEDLSVIKQYAEDFDLTFNTKENSLEFNIDKKNISFFSRF